MKWYKLSFSFITAIFGAIFLFASLFSILTLNIIKFVFAMFWFLLVWRLYLYLKRDGKFAFEASFVFVVILWSFFVAEEYKWYKKIVFVIENGIDEYSSLALFLTNLFFELIFFLPLNISLILGLYILIKKIIKKGKERKTKS